AETETTAETTAETAADTEPVDDAVKAKYPLLTSLPVLYITLDRGKISSVDKETYVPGSYTLVTPDGGIYEKPLTIRGRGNYSWWLPMKPYNLKLGRKTDLLDMGAAKNWVLITTFSDKTLLRSYLVLNLAVRCGIRGAVEVRYVDVFFNGAYNGLYLLSEKIQAHEERVDIEGTGTLFEIEMPYRHDDCSACVITSMGLHLMTDYHLGADPEYITEGDLLALKARIDRAESAMSSDKAYGDYIDTDSFVKWYIVNEFSKNYDSNFTTSCYCYLNEEGRLAMGPPWDFDTCMGNQDSTATGTSPKGFHVADAPWYAVLLKNPSFRGAVEEMWTALRDRGVFDDLYADIDAVAEAISESRQLTHERWPDALGRTDLRGAKSLFTYQEELDWLREWTAGRIDWLDDRFHTG
ncbi:MAG: CotH kinase family protein, partial [Eubacteriales bacterium]|nr:CotH kinase family protein [Eubacteriales bacterium]